MADIFWQGRFVFDSDLLPEGVDRTLGGHLHGMPENAPEVRSRVRLAGDDLDLPIREFAWCHITNVPGDSPRLDCEAVWTLQGVTEFYD